MSGCAYVLHCVSLFYLLQTDGRGLDPWEGNVVLPEPPIISNEVSMKCSVPYDHHSGLEQIICGSHNVLFTCYWTVSNIL